MKKHTTRKLTAGGFLLGVAILLPQVFHWIGAAGMGNLLLPMHLPVLLGGLLLGPWYGGVVGVVAPLASFLLTGMPAAVRLPFMVLELVAYGVGSGWLARLCAVRRHPPRVYAALVGAMVGGRAVYALALWIAANWFAVPCGGPIAAVTATVTGIWGIVIQVAVLPPLWYVLQKRGVLDGLDP